MKPEDKNFLIKFLKGLPVIFVKLCWVALSTIPFRWVTYDIGINGKVWIEKIS